VKPGSILLSLRGSKAALDAAAKDVREKGLKLPSFDALAAITTTNGKPTGKPKTTAGKKKLPLNARCKCTEQKNGNCVGACACVAKLATYDTDWNAYCCEVATVNNSPTCPDVKKESTGKPTGKPKTTAGKKKVAVECPL